MSEKNLEIDIVDMAITNIFSQQNSTKSFFGSAQHRYIKQSSADDLVKQPFEQCIGEDSQEQVPTEKRALSHIFSGSS